jgi:hypothetical protein
MPYTDPVDAFESHIGGITRDLAAGDYRHGAEGLLELSRTWAKAGLSQSSFENMRKHLIDTAIQDSDELFMVEKLTIEERNLRNERKFIIH